MESNKIKDSLKGMASEQQFSIVNDSFVVRPNLSPSNARSTVYKTTVLHYSLTTKCGTSSSSQSITSPPASERAMLSPYKCSAR